MINLTDVSRIYNSNDEVKALDNVSLSFPSTGMVFIVGKSGCGKSTLLNIMAGFDKPTHGKITFNDINLTDYTNYELDYYRNSTIGFIFQDYCLIETFTTYQNIKMVCDFQKKRLRRKEIDLILEKVGMKGYGRRLPKQLSAGQKQRVAIARALAKNPKVILADEPTGNLDSKTTTQILDLLKEISKDRLVVIVSHNKDDANLYADRIIELSNGTIKSDKSRNYNFDNSYIMGENEIILPSKGRLDDYQLKEINEKIKNTKGKVTFYKELDEFLDHENIKEIDESYRTKKTKMGLFNLIKYSWLFLKNHIFSFTLVIMIVTCLITILSVSMQFGDYDGRLQYQEIIKNENYEALVIRKKSQEEIETGTTGSNVYLLDNETKSKIKGLNEYKYYDLYTYNLPIKSSGYYYKRIDGNSGAIYKGNLQAANNLVVCDMEFLNRIYSNSGQVVLAIGTIKANGDGIIITDYLADNLLKNYKEKEILTYEDIISHDNYLYKTFGVKIDAIIKTNYKEIYKSAIDYLNSDSYDSKSLLDENLANYYEAIQTKYSYVYTLNPNYYQEYLTLFKSIRRNSYSLALSEYSIVNGEKEYNQKNYSVNFNENYPLEDNEIMISVAAYNELFDAEIEASDIKTFEGGEKVTLKIFDNNKNAYINKEFTIKKLLTSGLIINQDYIEDIIDNNYGNSGYIVTGSDLAAYTTYAIDNNLYVDSLKLTVVNKAISVVKVFEELFSLLKFLMFVAIATLIIIHTINTVNKNIYNIGVSRSMGAHMFELGIIFSVQMILFGGLVITAALFADYYTTNILNKLISGTIPKVVELPGADKITYVYFNPLITSVCSGLIMFLTIIAIFIPIIIIRKMNPVNIIKKR